MTKEIHINISDRTKCILRDSRIENKRLFLPSSLDRKEYTDVNKIIEEIGGKWKKGSKCHEFNECPSDKIKELLDGGKLIDEQKTFQSYFTPPNLAARVVQIADVNGKLVLEPSAGTGNIVKEILIQGCKFVCCYEINKEYNDQLFKNVCGSSKVSCILWDFLDVYPHTPSYDVIILNPPFSKNQWLKHLFHAYEFLKMGGKLVALLPNNRTNTKLVDWLKDKDYIIHNVEDGAFKEAGTLISTMILEVNKL